MPEPQSLNAALFGAVVALSGVVVYLYREIQKLHLEAKSTQEQMRSETRTAQEQMLRVMVVTEKALESFTQETGKFSAQLTGDWEEMRDAIVLMKERQSTILNKLSLTSEEKSKRTSSH